MIFKKGVYLDGKDNLGWSIDNDYQAISFYIKKSSQYKVTPNINKAQLVYNLWWNNILQTLPEYCQSKKQSKKNLVNLLVTCSNYIDPQADYFDQKDNFVQVKNIVDAWICPSTKQKKILDNMGLKTFYFPFSLNFKIFAFKKLPKQQICQHLKIDFNLIKNKIIIGSFQRDTLGSDLKQEKWQKNPSFLIKLLSNLPKDKFVLLLAGPRRHFILHECKKNFIPYIYLGQETQVDDLQLNALDYHKMPWLYALIDLYLISSKSEGGPKAVLEAIAMKKFIMSTDVGLASDFINRQYIFQDELIYQECLCYFIKNYHQLQSKREKIIHENYLRLINIIGAEKMQKQFEIMIASMI